MGKARVKSYVMYMIQTFDGQAKCQINCYPQQKWDYCIGSDEVILERNGIKLWIPKEDFEQRWKVIE